MEMLGFWVRIIVLLLLLVAIVAACFTFPIDQILKDFLYWVDQDLGRWGPLVLAVAYIPLTILAVPASVLTVGGGYLYGLMVGFVADSIGATLGSTAAFLLGRIIGGSFVIAKVKDYPKFRSIEVAVEKSGFKIVLLLRLVPLLSFNLLNYLLSVTPVSVWEYVLASWLGMLPITLALVYVGTTLKDLSDVTHGWNDMTPSHWAFLILSFVVSVILMVWVTIVAKNALNESLEDGSEIIEEVEENESFISNDQRQDLERHLISKVSHKNGES